MWLIILTYQNNILKVLATKSARQTYIEKPSASFFWYISLYCGMYGTTPPKTIIVEQHHLVIFRMVISLTSSTTGSIMARQNIHLYCSAQRLPYWKTQNYLLVEYKTNLTFYLSINNWLRPSSKNDDTSIQICMINLRYGWKVYNSTIYLIIIVYVYANI